MKEDKPEIDEGLTNGEVKGKGDVNTIEDEDIASGEGLIEKRVVDEDERGGGMGSRRTR